ncbi:MOSC domain-containing protein [Salinisphaera orenii]|uniref:MOSC domain-containing protein n=1 Tax=Salinisphaera orenii TaxID=856731 RepID=UPI000DBE3FA0
MSTTPEAAWAERPSRLPATRVRELRVASAVPFGGGKHRSGIDKQPVTGPLTLSSTGLAGDEQGDQKHHGGAEKAVHHYAFEHYAAWCDDYPGIACRLRDAGAFGENLVTRGLDETTVCVGDVFEWGGARIQVSQARQPCWRLNVRFNEPRMARLVQQTRRTGWYYRVLEPGPVAAGESLVLVERPALEWPLNRLLHYLYVDTLNREALAAITALTPLTESWRDLAAKRLDRARVEDWRSRVETPAD